ncbi:hypothetical protein BLNAU_14171 [Blattamonas nauphoetae]|uniref:Uncharacterized protein n=1 Tax=Blattamonas nauphoetae TaxID=2049346 RepID=A0ABQ9XGR6_9EUKA|nr:hypothetical protein BLNAU_14171 [Blattamonas nauphoetae]
MGISVFSGSVQSYFYFRPLSFNRLFHAQHTPLSLLLPILRLPPQRSPKYRPENQAKLTNPRNTSLFTNHLSHHTFFVFRLSSCYIQHPDYFFGIREHYSSRRPGSS